MALNGTQTNKSNIFMMELNKIYKGDCVDIITKKITNNSVHLIFADPPYNLSGNSLNH